MDLGKIVCQMGIEEIVIGEVVTLEVEVIEVEAEVEVSYNEQRVVAVY